MRSFVASLLEAPLDMVLSAVLEQSNHFKDLLCEISKECDLFSADGLWNIVLPLLSFFGQIETSTNYEGRNQIFACLMVNSNFLSWCLKMLDSVVALPSGKTWDVVADAIWPFVKLALKQKREFASDLELLKLIHGIISKFVEKLNFLLFRFESLKIGCWEVNFLPRVELIRATCAIWWNMPLELTSCVGRLKKRVQLPP
jgi:hypothetical protein